MRSFDEILGFADDPLAADAGVGADRREDPELALPKPGGATFGLGQAFSADPLSGAATFSIPLPDHSVRQAAGHGVGLGYTSVGGPSPFGHGWALSLDRVTRNTRRGVPLYGDDDSFVLGGRQLVPDTVSRPDPIEIDGVTWHRTRYRTRVEGRFDRIDYWYVPDAPETGHWRVTSGRNLTTIYGQNPAARIAHPGNPTQVADWLVERRYDPFGNAVAFDYKPEDLSGVSGADPAEAARVSGRAAISNRHLKRIRWGARVPYAPDGPLPDFFFQLVFDYGEHRGPEPTLAETRDWAKRPDPFSDRRHGFDRRTYRLCERVLLFHDFPELGTEPQIVSSTDFSYEIRAGTSVMTETSSTGFGRTDQDDLSVMTTPPLNFLYPEESWDDTRKSITLEPASLPQGAGLPVARFAKLDAGPLAGLLYNTDGGLSYARNLGHGSFAAARRLGTLPACLAKSDTRIAFQNLDGTPQVHAVRYEAGGQSGAAALDMDDKDGGWDAFRPFRHQPSQDGLGVDARFVDLTGDGRPDLLFDTGDHFTWLLSHGRAGFRIGGRVAKALDTLDGPRLALNESQNALFIADMTADGLPDLVRIRHNQVAYWPNLGHGNFGPMIVMAGQLAMGSRDAFDARLCRLVDVDGSGPADLIWLGDGIQVFRNSAGNRFAPPVLLRGLGRIGSLDQVDMLDLTGSGTLDFVRSDMTGSGFDYLDPLAGRRAHVITGYVNNQGLETRVDYATSVQMQRQSERDGAPWVTELPIVVPCVSRIETVDHISGRRFAQSMAYAHGAYDYEEREFRGFARTDTLDTEQFEAGADPATFQAPVLTRRWSSVGEATGHPARFDLHAAFAHEFYSDPAFEEVRPAPFRAPSGWSAADCAAALFAVRGLPLRTEIYGMDGTADQQHPYSVTHQQHDLALRQAATADHPGVVQPLPAENVTYALDRAPSDPRVTHSLVLARGTYGQPARVAEVRYPRRSFPNDLPAVVATEHARLEITVSEAEFTQALDVQRDYQLPRHSRLDQFALRISPPGGAALFTRDQLNDDVDDAARIELHETPGLNTLRLLRRSEVEYQSDDLAGPLPFGMIGRLGLTHGAFALAWSDGLAGDLLQPTQLADIDFASLGFVRRARADQWWQPANRATFPTDAAAHFFLPTGAVDALGRRTGREYDRHDLLIEASIDRSGHRTEAKLDYRHLSPTQVTDINGNRMAARLDPLGRLEAMVNLGRVGDAGDTFERPSLRVTYDLDRWRLQGLPALMVEEQRQTIGDPDSFMRVQRSFLSGAGGVWQTKTRDDPGPALAWDPTTGDFSETDTGAAERWHTTGSDEITNKGKKVRVWEPFFSTSDDYLPTEALLRVGASATHRHDPLGRIVETHTAEGTIVRTVYGPWQRQQFDANDTVRDSPWYAARGAPNPNGPMPAAGPARAAWLAAQHHGTEGTLHLGISGDAVAAFSRLSTGSVMTSRLAQPIPGYSEEAYDATDRLCFEARKNYLGATIISASVERPAGVVIANAAGDVAVSWSGRDRRFRNLLDGAGRTIGLFERMGSGPERLSQLTIYGDTHAERATRRLAGHVVAVFDDSGATFTDGYDMLGAPTGIRRRLSRRFDAEPDWSGLLGVASADLVEGAADAMLEGETFSSAFEMDAFGQMRRATLPGGDLLDQTQAASGRTIELGLTLKNGTRQRFLTGSQANALGQVTSMTLGNGITLRHQFDPLSHRVARRTCARPADGRVFQEARFEYDPLGNIVEHSDDAAQAVFFDNAVASASKQYEYDAFGRLIRATGRESAALSAGPPNAGDAPRGPIPHPNDADAVRSYEEIYTYDPNHNLRQMRHVATGNQWTRHYQYAVDLDPTDRTNRLIATSAPGDPSGGPLSLRYEYDDHGVMTSMPHIASLQWTAHDQMRSVDLGGGGTMTCRYGADGSLVRKVIERPGALRLERIYLGQTEIFRRFVNDRLVQERRTIFLAVDGARIAQVDIEVLDTATPANTGTQTVQYFVDGVSGSSSITFDGAGNCIGLEEFHPFGTTAYKSGRSDAETSLRRYRWLARERDADTGLIRIGARHYAPWLGRWITADPLGVGDGPNLFAYAGCNPISRRDVNGMKTGSGTDEYSHTLPEDLQPDLGNPDAASGERLRDWLEGQIVQDGDRLIKISDVEVTFEQGQWRATSVRTPVAVIETDPETGETTTRALPTDTPSQDVQDGSDGTDPTNTDSLAPTGADSETSDAADEDGTVAGLFGSVMTSVLPAMENSVWRFPGTLRGTLIDYLGGNTTGLMAEGADIVTDTHAIQVRSHASQDLSDLRTKVRAATLKATAFSNDLSGTGGALIPQAEIVLPRDTPDELVRQVETTFSRPGSYDGKTSRVRARPSTRAGVDALDPTVSRGMPSRMRFFGPAMSIAGGGFSAYALYDDIQRGDAAMGGGDALGVAGAGVELAALARSSSTLLRAGGVLGGASVAATSAVRSYRAFAEGNTEAGLVNALGVVGGVMLIAAAVVTGPWLAAGLLLGGLAITIGVAFYNMGQN